MPHDVSAVEVVARIHDPSGVVKSTSQHESRSAERVESAEIAGKSTRRRSSALSAAARLESNLAALREELEDEDGEAGSVSFFGVCLLKVVLARSRAGQAIWVLMSYALATAELLAVLAVAVGIHYQKCLNDDDCKVGSVCMFLHHRNHGWLNQAICFDCQGVSQSSSAQLAGWENAVRKLIIPESGVDGLQFTPVRTGDRWEVAVDAAEYCANQLVDPAISTWHHDGFSKCIYVQQELRRFGLLDSVVFIVALFIVCASISKERQQQLFVQHLRQKLLPPPWRSLRAAGLKLVELVVGCLLPSITTCRRY